MVENDDDDNDEERGENGDDNDVTDAEAPEPISTRRGSVKEKPNGRCQPRVRYSTVNTQYHHCTARKRERRV